MSTIDTPAYNKAGTELELEAKSVKTIAHAWNICRATEQNNRTRAARTADIQSLHDGAPPRSAAGNAEKAKAWQSNASTGWLSGVVGRVSQRFVNATISQIYVSSSSLPSSVTDYKRKTDLLRAKFTNLIRSWDGYTGLINSKATETVLQGYCYSVFLDPYTYKPTFFKQDRAYVPEMAGQHARELQFFVAKMDYRLDEFLLLFRDEKAAEEVGYDIDNCLYAANHAKMQSMREDAGTTEFRKFVEMINEGVLGLAFTDTGARVVNTYLLFNREYDGKVSFWLIDRDSGKKLRFSFKLFKSMPEVLAMFSFEPGNGCIHSSKGLGRKLAPLAIMKELFRNSIIDASRMSSLLILRCDAKDKTKFAPAVMSPFIMVDKSVEVAQQQFQANSDESKTTDLLIDSWAEQSVGAYLTNPINDEGKTEKTATEAQIDARREMEAADIQIRRWLDQEATETQIIQSRAFHDDVIAEARRLYEIIVTDPAKGTPDIYEGHEPMDPLQLRTLVEVMMDGLTDDEIRVWRDSPATVFAHVSDKAIQQGIAAVKTAFGQDPGIDQNLLTYKTIEGMVGAEVAKELWIPQANTTLEIEAARQQMSESVDMSVSKLPIPVSPRDNHIIHGQTIQKLLTAMAEALSTPQASEDQLKNTELNLNHMGEHLQYGEEQNLAGNPVFQELQKFYDGFKKQLTEVIQIRADAAAAQAAVTQQLSLNQPTAQAAPPESAALPSLDTATGVPGQASETAQPLVDSPV